MLKHCNKCNSDKDTNCFSVRNSKTGLLSPWCRSCASKYDKAHYKKLDAKTKKLKVAAHKGRVKRNSAYVWEYLSSHPCVDCGENNPIFLDFDHTNNKERHVSDLSRSGCGIEKIQLEIDKCEIRCLMCHRLKTIKQMGWYKDILSVI